MKYQFVYDLCTILFDIWKHNPYLYPTEWKQVETNPEKVRNDIGADFLGYNDSENLANAVGIPHDSMCFTCFTGNYSSLGIKPVFKTRIKMKGE